MTTNTIPATETYRLTPVQVAATLERIDAFNALAARKGLPARVTLNVGPAERVEKGTDDWGHAIVETEHECTLDGTTLAVPGDWQVAAVLDLAADGNIVRSNPHFTAEALPVEFRTSDTRRCDECGIRIARKSAVVVWSPVHGFRQVGGSCVQVLLGMSPESVIAWLAGIASLVETGASSGRREIEVGLFVRLAALATKVYGFTPTSVERGEPTRMVVEGAIYGSAEWRRAHPEMAAVSPAVVAEADLLAVAALEWIAASTDGSDYLANLRTAAAREHVGRNGGLLASLPQAYLRTLADAAEKAAKAERPASTYLGETGAKVRFTAEVVSLTESESDYGLQVFAVMVTADGQIVWYSTGAYTAAASALGQAHEAKQPVEVAATVKALRTNRNGEQVTVITRAKAGEDAAPKQPGKRSRKAEIAAAIAYAYGDTDEEIA